MVSGWFVKLVRVSVYLFMLGAMLLQLSLPVMISHGAINNLHTNANLQLNGVESTMKVLKNLLCLLYHPLNEYTIHKLSRTLSAMDLESTLICYINLSIVFLCPTSGVTWRSFIMRIHKPEGLQFSLSVLFTFISLINL